MILKLLQAQQAIKKSLVDRPRPVFQDKTENTSDLPSFPILLIFNRKRKSRKTRDIHCILKNC